MGSTTDLIGSFVIGGLVIVIILSLNYNLSNTTFQRSQDLISQQASVELLNILENDLYKAGYRTTATPVLLAESLSVAFLADLDDNGTIDSVRYTVGDTTFFLTTTNPHDRPLYRRLNAGSQQNVASGLTEFYFAYRDTAGSVIPYDSLKYVRHRSVVRLITFAFVIEPSDPLDSTFIPVTVEKVIHPKNIGGW